MTIHCLGSINVDHVHRVPHFPAAGETLSDTGYSTGLGGKGANQAIAAAEAGGEVRFIGAVGPDGAWTVESLRARGLDTSAVLTVDAATGHAVIYVDEQGENQIVIHGGANRAITDAQIATALGQAKPDDWWLTQNETNLVIESLKAARTRGLRTAYSAAPFDAQAVEAALPHLDLLLMNEGEATALREHLGGDPDVPMLVTTLGDKGAILRYSDMPIARMIRSFPVTPVDTTGAGDTFAGMLVGAMDQGAGFTDAARFAAAAAALAVTRPGAADAIPTRAEVDAFMDEHP